MIDLRVVIGILVIHWIADFVCQTDWQAKNKSKSWEALLQHTVTYSVIWYFSYLIYSHSLINSSYFLGITLICHTITDYFTSRLNSKLWAAGKVHWFFVSIGFDQILHYIQLLLTYQLLN